MPTTAKTARPFCLSEQPKARAAAFPEGIASQLGFEGGHHAPCEEMDSLKKELAMKVKFIEAQYESRLQEEAEALYTRINYKVKAFENHHKEGEVAGGRKLSDGFVHEDCSYLPRSLSGVSFVRHSKADVKKKKTFGVIFQIGSGAVDDPEKAWLKTENARLKDDVGTLHDEMEQIHGQSEADLKKEFESIKNSHQEEVSLSLRDNLKASRLPLPPFLGRRTGMSELTQDDLTFTPVRAHALNQGDLTRLKAQTRPNWTCHAKWTRGLCAVSSGITTQRMLPFIEIVFGNRWNTGTVAACTSSDLAGCPGRPALSGHGSSRRLSCVFIVAQRLAAEQKWEEDRLVKQRDPQALARDTELRAWPAAVPVQLPRHQGRDVPAPEPAATGDTTAPGASHLRHTTDQSQHVLELYWDFNYIAEGDAVLLLQPSIGTGAPQPVNYTDEAGHIRQLRGREFP
ncbi:hypothetical protein P4O66_002247 [Electrophorus voltai]|uniref:DUF4709 domain-containing protein n=1 Tax=Electrophorus voltai TaxID=2609070 RepID=A0AAD9DQY0_9TELE|nr:hypothetical protein P4O66_002247 [Electrophorus voltai]